MLTRKTLAACSQKLLGTLLFAAAAGDEEDKFATLTLGSQDGAKRVYRRSDTLRPDFQRKNIGHFLHRMCVNMVFASGKLR